MLRRIRAENQNYFEHSASASYTISSYDTREFISRYGGTRVFFCFLVFFCFSPSLPSSRVFVYLFSKIRAIAESSRFAIYIFRRRLHPRIVTLLGNIYARFTIICISLSGVYFLKFISYNRRARVHARTRTCRVKRFPYTLRMLASAREISGIFSFSHIAIQAVKT